MTSIVRWRMDPADCLGDHTYRISGSCNAYDHRSCSLDRCVCTCHGRTVVETCDEETGEQPTATPDN